MPIKLLIGGSPCTKWSIAQKNGRETKPEGEGWELFENYLIAREKFKPDFFLYENNKSAAQAIKDEIAVQLGVGTDPNARFTYINSALVSAQNRQRFYVTNFGDIAQPEDRGILLKDILEDGIVERDKAHCLKHQAGNARDYFKKHHTNVKFESVNMLASGKARCLTAGYANQGIKHILESNYSDNPNKQQWDSVAEPVRVGTFPNNAKNQKHDSQQYRIYSPNGKSVALCGNGGGMGAKTTGLYAIPIEFSDGVPVKAVSGADGKIYTVYEVKCGHITVKDKQYPIKLPDGYYIIRKLTVTECCRLQTLPDNYCKAVSATQGYKGLGNGWTAEVIIHLLNHALKNVPRDIEIVTLSMYDGIGTGRYCLDKMGFTNVRYYAYEIDKYAKTVANDNYPDIIQCGDVFDVRNDDWKMKEI